MSRKHKNDLNIRLAVGRINGANSAIFRLWSRRGESDIYASVRGMAAEIKISLHASGNCNAGLTDLFFSKQPEYVRHGIGNSRHQSKWSRKTQLGSNIVIPFKFLIPMSEFRLWRQNQEGISQVEITWIEPTGSDRSIVFLCAFSGQQIPDDAWPGRLDGTHFVASKCLPNGDKFWILWQDNPTSDFEKAILLEAREKLTTTRMIPFSGRDVEEMAPRILIFKECFEQDLLIVMDSAGY